MKRLLYMVTIANQTKCYFQEVLQGQIQTRTKSLFIYTTKLAKRALNPNTQLSIHNLFTVNNRLSQKSLTSANEFIFHRYWHPRLLRLFRHLQKFHIFQIAIHQLPNPSLVRKVARLSERVPRPSERCRCRNGPLDTYRGYQHTNSSNAFLVAYLCPLQE